MDAFFASVEQMDDPSLRGKAVLVGGGGLRGVVAAASYEARKFGCHSAMPMSQAKRLCPAAVIVKVRFSRYREISDRMFTIFDAFSPLVEPLSVDEAFLDLSGTERLLGEPEAVAGRLKIRIKTELGLNASVGVAPNKFLAKLASDFIKPDGLLVLRPGEVEGFLVSLPIGKLWGIGPVTAAKVRRVGIETVGDLRKRAKAELEKLFGQEADRFIRLANGIDHRPVINDRAAKSVGQEQTFGTNLTEPGAVEPILFQQVEQVGRRLRKSGMLARTVSLKIRYGDFETITRSSTLDEPTSGTAELWQAAKVLFERWCEASFQPVRLIGMSASQLTTGAGQLVLFTDPDSERQKKVDAVADQITKKFGNHAIRRGGGLEREEI
jgi:DNA polymerase-4